MLSNVCGEFHIHIKFIVMKLLMTSLNLQITFKNLILQSYA